MANITFNNTANIADVFKIGINNPEKMPDQMGNPSVGQAMSYLIDRFYEDAYEPISQALQDLNGWTVSNVSTTPAGSSTASTVTFQKNFNGQDYEFSVSGNLSNGGNSFTLNGSAFMLKVGHHEVDFIATTPVRIDFVQTDTSRTYETQLNFYNGDPEQARTTVGALPIGAEITNMTFAGGRGLPIQLRQIATEADDDTWVVMQGSFREKTEDIPGFEGGLEGTLTSMVAYNDVNENGSIQAKFFNFSNATFKPDEYNKQGFFNNANASISVTQVDRTEGPVEINVLTQLPILPSAGVSSMRYTGASINLAQPFFDSESIIFSGHDIFNITSTTDVVVEAGDGNDLVNAGSGNDIIWGGKGDDRLNGGAGNDLFLVDQHEGFGPISTWTYGQTRVGPITVFTETLGHDLIDGGDGLDTLSFVQPDADWPFTQPNNIAPAQDITPNNFPPVNPEQSFMVGEYGRENLVDLGISNTAYGVERIVINPYMVAAVELSPKPGFNGNNQVRVIDLETRQLLGSLTLSPGESLASTSVTTGDYFYTQKVEDLGNGRTALKLNTYDFGPNANTSFPSVGPEKTYNFNIDLNNGYFDDFVNLDDPQNAYAFFNPPFPQPPSIYKLNPFGDAISLQLPVHLVNPSDVDWISQGFVDDANQLWMSVNTNWNQDNRTWDETYLRYNTNNFSWVEVDDDTFWNTWDHYKAQDTIYRTENGVFDARDLSKRYGNEMVEMGGGFALGNGNHFVTVYTELPQNGPSDLGIGFERWLIVDSNGNIRVDRSFDDANTLGIRGLEKIEVKDGYYYFQTLNGSFNGSIANGITSITQPFSSAVSLYRVPVDSLEGFLQSPLGTGVNNPYAEKVRDFSKVDLTGANSQLAILQEYWPAETIQVGNLSGGAYFVSSDVNFNTEGSRLFLGKVEGNGAITRTMIDGDWLQDYVLHAQTGQLYLLVEDESSGNYTKRALQFDSYTGQVKAISLEQWHHAENNVPAIGALTYDGPPNLQLVLPSSYYGKLPNQFTQSDEYGSSNGQIGFRSNIDQDNNTQTYTLGQAPADGSIGILFNNSYSNAEELVHLKNVEFLEIPNANGGITEVDIRPLYLASRGNDTLYAMDRSNFDALVTVFNNDHENPRDFPDRFNDPLAWYRNNFAVQEWSNGPEWRYYLNGGSGNDVLHGTKNEGQSTQVDRIQFIRDQEGRVQLTFEHANYDSISIEIFKPTYLQNWFSWNQSIVSQINQLQIGISAQRGANNGEIILSGLGLTGWTVQYDTSATPLGNAEPNITQGQTVQELGRDTLDGGAGADIMIGYSGNDAYFVDNPGDVVIESPLDEGFDTVLTTVTYTIQGNNSVERMQVHQIMPNADDILFTEVRATAPASDSATINLTGNNYTRELMGHNGANTITAGSLAGIFRPDHPSIDPKLGAILLGMGGTDRLIGGDRNDHLFGGTGNDTLIGNAGDDRFYMGFQLSNDEVAQQLLPHEFSILNTLGLNQRWDELTGGADIATGGDGFDTVVVGVAPSEHAEVDGTVFYQRISENQIRISTLVDSIVVDATMEAVEYLTGHHGNYQNEVRLLPWVNSRSQQDNDRFFTSRSLENQAQNAMFAFVAPSNFSDWIDLSAHPAIGSGVSTSFDGGNGNDVIYGDLFGQFSTIKGGNGDDHIYSGHYFHENEAWRYELLGEGGNDTLTFKASHATSMPGAGPVQILLDGGVGNDHYRVLMDNPSVSIRIEDSAGLDELTLALDLDDDFEMFWDANELRVYNYFEDTDNSPTVQNLFLSADANALERLFITEDTEFFSHDRWGGNLVKPNTVSYATGRMTGTAGNDILLPMLGIQLDYDGGAGDDLIIMNSVTGGIVSGGAGNNRIFFSDNPYYLENRGIALPATAPEFTLSYRWAPGGASSEINLEYGYGYVFNQNGLLGSDRWEKHHAPLVNVIGGSSHDRIIGSSSGNRLDGDAGNDTLFSGQNTTAFDADLGTWVSGRDHLLGGLGNDTLVDETHWSSVYDWGSQLFLGNDDDADRLINTSYFHQLLASKGSLLEGGGGDDTYVIQSNGATPSLLPTYQQTQLNQTINGATVLGNYILNYQSGTHLSYEDLGYITPTRIVERDANGRDTGGRDTIRFVTSDTGLTSYDYEQRGSIVSISLPTTSLQVGDSILVGFQTGNIPSNAYTIDKVTVDAQTQTSLVEFQVPNSANFIGQAFVTSMGFTALYDWVDNDNLAIFAGGDVFTEVLNDVSSGMPTTMGFDGTQLKSALPVQAIIDRNAIEFIEFGTNNPEEAGFRLPVSLNVGRENTQVEMVIAGGPGDAVLFGGQGTDIIIDTPYEDILLGGDGHDILVSNIGYDIVDGGSGNDSIHFRSDGQIIIGGLGADNFVIQGIGTGRAIITDYKPWEGDTLGFESDWLDDFMSANVRAFGPQFSHVEVTANAFDPGASNEFMISAHFFENSDTEYRSFDLVRVRYNSDLDRAWDQQQMALYQLESSIYDAAADQGWDLMARNSELWGAS